MEPMLSEYATCAVVRAGWIVQPKLNGLRCWYSPTSRAMFTRGGHVITSCHSLLAQLISLGQPIDGELYVHGWTLERIRCAVQRLRPSDDSMALHLHAFDLASPARPQTDRLDELAALALPPMVDRVETRTIPNADAALAAYGEWLASGYEGIIMRDPSAVYQFGKRVTFKHKLNWD